MPRPHVPVVTLSMVGAVMALAGSNLVAAQQDKPGSSPAAPAPARPSAPAPAPAPAPSKPAAPPPSSPAPSKPQPSAPAAPAPAPAKPASGPAAPTPSKAPAATPAASSPGSQTPAGTPAKPAAPNAKPATPAISPSPQAPAPAAGQPAATPKPPGVNAQGGAGGGGTVPTIRPLTINGVVAPTPYWWGPNSNGQHTTLPAGPIRTGYIPMGQPARLPQPPRYAPPGSPDRQTTEVASGPLPPPGPSLSSDAHASVLPVSEPTALQRRVLIDVGSGAHVEGHVEGRNYRVAFTSGGNPFFIDRFGYGRDIGSCGYVYRRHHRFHGYGAGYPLYYGYSSDYFYGPVYGQLVRVETPDPFVTNETPQPPPPPAIDETKLSALERGHLALERDEPKVAVEFYKAHLAAQESDADAMRWLAVALMANGQPQTGVAMMALAYQTDPSLALIPLSASRFPGGDSGLMERFSAATGYANSNKTSSAYLAAAVLAQAQGRSEVALKLLAKAKAAGLDRVILRELEGAMIPKK